MRDAVGCTLPAELSTCLSMWLQVIHEFAVNRLNALRGSFFFIFVNSDLHHDQGYHWRVNLVSSGVSRSGLPVQ